MTTSDRKAHKGVRISKELFEAVRDHEEALVRLKTWSRRSGEKLEKSDISGQPFTDMSMLEGYITKYDLSEMRVSQKTVEAVREIIMNLPVLDYEDPFGDFSEDNLVLVTRQEKVDRRMRLPSEIWQGAQELEKEGESKIATAFRLRKLARAWARRHELAAGHMSKYGGDPAKRDPGEDDVAV